jgi:hypothetical protein
MTRIALLLALACTGWPGVAQKVRVDYDRTLAFSHYRTYQWIALPEAQPANGQFPNQLMQERIVRFIEDAMAAKGLRRVETGGDVLIGYKMNVTEQQQFTTVGSGWGWGWGSEFSTTTAETIFIGTLVIDIMDARQKQLIFQGASIATISSRPQKNTKKLRKAINEIFEKYPPKP